MAEDAYKVGEDAVEVAKNADKLIIAAGEEALDATTKAAESAVAAADEAGKIAGETAKVVGETVKAKAEAIAEGAELLVTDPVAAVEALGEVFYMHFDMHFFDRQALVVHLSPLWAVEENILKNIIHSSKNLAQQFFAPRQRHSFTARKELPIFLHVTVRRPVQRSTSTPRRPMRLLPKMP